MSEEQWESFAAALGAFPGVEVDQDRVDARIGDMPNDEKDRHVLAAAVEAGAELVVTNNLKHFRARDVARVGVRAASADDYLCELLDRAPLIVREALALQAESMKKPRQWTVRDVLGALSRGSPPANKFVAAVEQRFGIAPVEPPPQSLTP
jgi:uncharacterized membrane-anchored protein